MGQNGAGKSTLVNTSTVSSNLHRQVLVNGVETTKSSVASLARNVGFVFQNPDHQLSAKPSKKKSRCTKNFGFKHESSKNESHGL